MKIIRFPDKKNWSKILIRPVFETAALEETVSSVLKDIRNEGDTAVRRYSEKFDKVSLTNFEVTEEEKTEALKEISENLKRAVQIAVENITKFHEAQKSPVVNIETTPGVNCWQKSVPIEKIGLYIPGGTAPLFSTVLMLAIPARIAGCNEIILCSPPGKDGKLNQTIVYAAQVAGVTRLFKIGGVQAIAAMAFGTHTIPGVYKIFGPGNQYVTTAKQMVARLGVAIDMPAGPSEVAVLANESSNPVFVASDLLSQAEHGADSQVILISTSEKILEQTKTELEEQLDRLPRKEYASRALENSRMFLVRNDVEMMELVNAYAPEHLIISTDNADELSQKVINAGSVFIGEYTPESAGDYASGTNHTLPTNGYARSYSGVNLDAYNKKITFQKITRQGLEKIGPAIETMALAEELTAHQRAIELRLKHSND